jgi:DNA polymerase-3 subunit alpha
VAKLIPTIPVGISIQKALKDSRELQMLYETQASVKRLVDAASSVEGVARNVSTHAAGVVVAGEPLVEHVPLQRASKSDTALMAQYAMKPLEKIGLLKMDFLGLANLTMLQRAVEYVGTARGIKLDLSRLPPDDPLTFDKLSDGETHSVFQLEGSGMTRYTRELKPTNIRHLVALVSLYRPGPMAHLPTYIRRKEGREPVVYPDPSLEDLLEETYGIIVYQDQVLQIVQRVAGYSLGQADILRRAMGKKLPQEMKRERQNFLSGARKQGYSAEVANKLWEYIEPFAGYAFPKAHAACYALIAYQTAYLKANFPAEWMAAVLTTEADKTERVVSAIGECRRLGIKLLRPDINRSQSRFTVEVLGLASNVHRPASGREPGTETSDVETMFGIRYGLAAVKNVGSAAVESVIAERERGGLFRSLDDFCARVDLSASAGLNKRSLESLVKCGAMDDFGPRERVLAGLEQCISAGQQMQRAAGLGQTSLFDMMGSAEGDQPGLVTVLPEARAIGQRGRLAWEKESLGLFFSDHPFQEAAAWLAKRVTANSAQLGPDLANERIVVAGVVTALKRITTKRKELMAVATLEDLHGSAEVTVFPRTYATTEHLWQTDAVLLVAGKVDIREDRVQIICDSVEAFEVPDSPPPVEEARRPATDGRGPENIYHDEQGDAAGRNVGTVAAEEESGNGVSKATTNGDARLNSEVRFSSSDSPVSGRHQPPALVLSLTVTRTGNQPRDIHTLERLHALLPQDGPDAYEILLAAGSRSIRVSNPQARTRYSPQLEDELVTLLGPNSVQIRSPARDSQ